MSQIVSIVRLYSKEIQNGRTLRDIAEHTQSELVELNEEIEKVEKGEDEGSDGIVGEAIDIIACALDAIFKHQPDITEAELDALMYKKCEKWKRYYSESVTKSAG